MIYPYKCTSCATFFDVTKRISEFERDEYCPKCQSKAERKIASGYFTNAKVEDAEFCPALGCVVRNSNHRRKIAKERGMIEVGNEDTNKWYEQAQKDKEAEIKRFYDSIADTRIITRSL